MGHFTPKSYTVVDIEEFNKWLKYCEKNKVLVHREKAPGEKVSLRAYLVIKEVECQLTFKYGARVSTYITRLDGQKAHKPSGLKAWTEVNKFYKVPREKFPGKTQHSSSAVLYFNEKYTNTRIENCYGYDINSAYTWAMTQPMPDTSVKPEIGRKVKKGEIGFDSNYNLVFPGHFANLVYPCIESPFKKFAEVWYNKKKNAKTTEEKQIAKDVLNASIGYFQNTNPILRTAILWYANNRVRSLIDENTLYCNTDSIISKVRRLDIEKDLGPELGQWKLEHTGAFAYKSFTYQWNFDIPSYRGISKSWFKKGWDLLKDEVPKCGNTHYYNKTTNKIEVINNG